jgi:hypothetical protein
MRQLARQCHITQAASILWRKMVSCAEQIANLPNKNRVASLPFRETEQQGL